MKTKLLISALVGLLAGCASGATTDPTLSPTLQPTQSSTPTATYTEIPTNSPDLNHLDPSVILFEQDFEAGTSEGLSIASGEWNISGDSTGNHSLCNKPVDIYSVFTFGKSWWKDYAVEMKIKMLDNKQATYVALMTRNDGYYGSIDYINRSYELAVSPPEYRSLGQGTFHTPIHDLISLRLEAAGHQIKYYINDHLVVVGFDVIYSQGNAKVVISPGLSVCIAGIHAWSLTETGAIGNAPIKIPVSMEVVTDKAVSQAQGGVIPGNNWGGHQTRIVRTDNGVFTAYMIAGSGDFAREWQLARRQEDGSWLVIAQEDGGKDPVLLLASPDGTLHIIGWPGEVGTMWSGKPEGNQITMTRETIPNMLHSNWPRSSAGINAAGDLCILTAEGPKPGIYHWSCDLLEQGSWISRTTTTDYAFFYEYVFPDPRGGFSVVATRDVLWSVLGYAQPPDTSDYVYNAIGYWRTDDIINKPLVRVYLQEEIPTKEFPFVHLNAQQDAYIDTSGNMHIIYKIQGESTQGAYLTRHVVLSPEGAILKDVPLPFDIGGWARIFQDMKGKFYILGSYGDLYPAGTDGLILGTPYEIDLKSYPVEYPGIMISAPRSGTPISNVLDLVYSSENGTKWIYFQITLPEN